MEWLIRLRFVPLDDDDYDSPRFAAAGKKLVEALSAEFGSRCSKIAAVTDGSGKNRWHLGADAYAERLALLLDMHCWLQSGVADGVKSAHVKPSIGSDAELITRARWVELLGDTREVSLAVYPVGCTTCGRLRWERPPSPYRVSDKILKSPNCELFVEDNAVLVVTKRVRSLFHRHGASDIAEGPVEIAKRGDLNGEYFWIRPKHWIGPVASWYWSNPCSRCQVQQTRQLRCDEFPAAAMLLRSFGKSRSTLVRVGDWPLVKPKIKNSSGQPSATLNVAVAGDLFKALHDEGVRGLAWPSDGPFISADPSEQVLQLDARVPESAPVKLDPATARKAPQRKRKY